MPRYFFSVVSPAKPAFDEEGEELADDVAAHKAAQQTAYELARDFEDAVVVVRCEGKVVTEVPIARRLN